jgi:trk system potassium uptake protein TrkA
VGSSLAANLIDGGHSVSVIDRRPEAFARLGLNFAGRTVVGIGFDRDRLTEAGIEEAGALAAVTSGDNSNILIARVARETFGIDRVVARIYDPRRATIYQRLGIPTVATVAWTTERVLRRILPDEPSVEWVDPSANVMLVERSIPAGWAGRSVQEFETRSGTRVVSLNRVGVGQLPKPTVVLQEGDVVYLGASGDALPALETALATPKGGSH